uniref:Reverse transcriptase n=1 Tax=Triatoma infestans TaxID=30076 RepID=A0A161MHD7_TRIIF
MQTYLSSLEKWFIKLNEKKYRNITFTLRRIAFPPVYYNLIPLLVVNVAAILVFT